MTQTVSFLVTCDAEGVWRAIAPNGHAYAGDLKGLPEHLDQSCRRQRALVSLEEGIVHLAGTHMRGPDAARILSGFCAIPYDEAVERVKAAKLWSPITVQAT